jgi:hypothetical protein
MLKKVLFFLFLAVVFSAVAVSAAQLNKKPASAKACGGSCTTLFSCARGCLCAMTVDGGEGFCVSAGAATAPSH